MALRRRRGWLVQRMCTPEHDPSRVLESRLRHAEPGKPVLKALQRSLFESLNRVLETARLEQGDPEFRASMQDADRAKYRDALEQYVVHGSVIFANRLLLAGRVSRRHQAVRFSAAAPAQADPRAQSHAQSRARQEPRVAGAQGGAVRGYARCIPEATTSATAAPAITAVADGISIGTAAAVSGAAVSPNMGYSSSPVTLAAAHDVQRPPRMVARQSRHLRETTPIRLPSRGSRCGHCSPRRSA